MEVIRRIKLPYKCIGLIMLFVFVEGCSDLKTISKYDNGQVKLECQTNTKNEYHGICNQYYESGSLEGVFSYSNGQLQGESTFYHENGNLYWSAFYNEGKRDGKVTYYDANGIKTKEIQLKKDVLEGVSYEYHKNGELKKLVYHSNGRLNGEFKEYDTLGNLTFDGRYKDDKLVDFKSFDSDGNVISEFLQYRFNTRLIGDSSIEVVINLINPQYDEQLFQVLKDDGEDHLLIINEVYAESGTINYRLELDGATNEIELLGQFLLLERLDNSDEFVVRGKQEFFERIDIQTKAG
jgi:antitoxin component YwqK of YwqJK toxin-antitoxin module